MQVAMSPVVAYAFFTDCPNLGRHLSGRIDVVGDNEGKC